MYWKQAYNGLFRHGIDAWWCDCTEPFEADWTDDPVKPEPEQRQRINVKEASTYIDPEYVCAYSLLHSKGIYEGQRSVSDKRVLNLTRSSYAGQQRYSTFTWSGDISANWTTLRKQIAEGLSFTSSGCPYWTLDIGGWFFCKELETVVWRWTL
ncbi:MAG: TIM-barrel domain-containing protein [Acetivibrionales bacterium]